jgi:hypothetical protein
MQHQNQSKVLGDLYRKEVVCTLKWLDLQRYTTFGVYVFKTNKFYPRYTYF